MALTQDSETAALLRRATAEAPDDLDRAIQTLREAREHMLASPVSYPVETWLRLPLYLQKAGRMKECLDAFKQVADETRWRIRHCCGHRPDEDQAKLRAGEHLVIREKLALALRRAAKRK